MKHIVMQKKYPLTFVLAGILAASPAIAEKPSSGGGGGNKHSYKNKHENREDGRRGGDAKSRGQAESRRIEHFDEHRRAAAHEYYRERFRSGHCPPGLAKKHNGCQPPGHAKKWHIGHQLPRDVIFYDVPPQLVIQLGQPPAGHRYIRVAKDILLITIGVGMVVDAIEDLDNM